MVDDHVAHRLESPAHANWQDDAQCLASSISRTISR
jgi:hypothetical protein